MAQHVVDATLMGDLDSLERRLKGDSKLDVGGRERGCRAAGETTVTEKQPERVRIEWDVRWRKHCRRSQQRQREAVLMRAVESADHLSNSQYAGRPAPTVFRGPDAP